jgi:hypothetical protein
MTEVNVYFPTLVGDSDEFPDDNPFNLSPVTRTVSADRPAEDICKATLAGPTDQEFDAGSLPVDSARLQLGHIAIVNGVCRVILDHEPDFAGFVSDLSKMALREALRKSLLELSTIDDVIVSGSI